MIYMRQAFTVLQYRNKTGDARQMLEQARALKLQLPQFRQISDE